MRGLKIKKATSLWINGVIGAPNPFLCTETNKRKLYIFHACYTKCLIPTFSTTRMFWSLRTLLAYTWVTRPTKATDIELVQLPEERYFLRESQSLLKLIMLKTPGMRPEKKNSYNVLSFPCDFDAYAGLWTSRLPNIGPFFIVFDLTQLNKSLLVSTIYLV